MHNKNQYGMLLLVQPPRDAEFIESSVLSASYVGRLSFTPLSQSDCPLSPSLRSEAERQVVEYELLDWSLAPSCERPLCCDNYCWGGA